MTWSIIAKDEATGQIGIAVATRFFAVGARVPFIAAGFGGIATQALVNPYYGIDGVALLRDGKSPQEIVATLIAADPGRKSRQLHILDMQGRIAVHTGRDCIDWCGHLAGDGVSIAGNMLAGPQVLDETATAYRASALPFAQRLIAALQAGEAAGGDKRGRQSAALLIHGSEEWSALDLRVDDHADPLAELERLERVSRMHWTAFSPFMPTRANPGGTTDRATIDAGIAAARAGQT